MRFKPAALKTKSAPPAPEPEPVKEKVPDLVSPLLNMLLTNRAKFGEHSYIFLDDVEKEIKGFEGKDKYLGPTRPKGVFWWPYISMDAVEAFKYLCRHELIEIEPCPVEAYHSRKVSWTAPVTYDMSHDYDKFHWCPVVIRFNTHFKGIS